MNFIRWTFLLGLSLAALPSRATDADPSLFERARSVLNVTYSGLEFYPILKADRVQALQEFAQAIRAQYSLFDLKKDTIGLDFNKLVQDTLERENAIEDSNDPDAQAAANLAFFDRMRAFTAAFQDTHFHVGALSSPDPVFLGLSFIKVDGKYYVASKSTKLMALNARPAGEDEFNQIAVGDELLEMDGLSPEQAMQSLLPYVSGSSAGARESRAIDAMTLRSFRFPESGFTMIKLKSAQGSSRIFKMPWFYGTTLRSDQTRYLVMRGFRKVNDLFLSWDSAHERWTSTSLLGSSYSPGAVIKGLLEAHAYYDADDADSLALRTGYLIKGGKAYGVMQVFSFNASRVNEENEKAVDFLPTLRVFIGKLKESNLPLILDIRSNGGGDGSYPATLLSMLSESGKIYPGPTQALRLTNYVRQLQEQVYRQLMFPGLFKGGVDLNTWQLVFRKSYAAGDSISAAYSTGDITPDEDIDGYDGKIVALLSPDCVSACDMMAFLLKSSGRATIIGQPSSGTGAGYLATSKIDTQWHDSGFILSSHIPSHLFGRPAAMPGVYVLEGQAAALNSENRPTIPDEEYATTLSDVKAGDKGWMNKAIEVLERH